MVPSISCHFYFITLVLLFLHVHTLFAVRKPTAPCAPGFYTNPENGDQCIKCECLDPNATCNPQTGECYCTAKGVAGPKCETCERKYVGDPKNGTPCRYELAVDFIFTFKLDADDEKDKHIKEIYFFSVPYKNVNVEFSISCESVSGAMVSMNLTSDPNTQTALEPTKCETTPLRRTFVSSDPLYPFGTEANTTFFAKVYNFATPIKIKASFAHPSAVSHHEYSPIENC
ncbi:hypothetical protein QR680_010594 [Steinernema hermaphroditum]|uniref:Laminin EGF-like domain-containing protein n=1 Tax=Steinernema hermaphroditum TaxID=289476 RepID=A0AA39IQQ3_9BILA|nr:hypothetical protein QR680_010594 [Steinernema hermaphroditum]